MNILLNVVIGITALCSLALGGLSIYALYVLYGPWLFVVGGVITALHYAAWYAKYRLLRKGAE